MGCPRGTVGGSGENDPELSHERDPLPRPGAPVRARRQTAMAVVVVRRGRGAMRAELWQLVDAAVQLGSGQMQLALRRAGMPMTDIKAVVDKANEPGAK